MAATLLVQKIRARAGQLKEDGQGVFPNEEAGGLFQQFISQQMGEQRVLVAALQWIEANVLEVKVVPPDLSEAVVTLLESEVESLRKVCGRVSDTAMRTKAGSKIPSREVRKQADATIQDLVLALHAQLGGDDWGSKEELGSLEEEMLGHVPCSIRIAALVHTCEFAKLRDQPYKSQEALAVAFSKQCLPERAIEVACRLPLEQAIELSNSVLNSDSEELRSAKAVVLERLFVEWGLRPSEEQLSALHVFPVETQLSMLLRLERDAELLWCKEGGKAITETEKYREMNELLNFSELLIPYLRQEGELRPLEKEIKTCIPKPETRELANLRKGSSLVLQQLERKYGWSPDGTTRRSLYKTSWVARTSALVLLANKTVCLHADQEIRNLLRNEGHRQLSVPDVLVLFNQWSNLHDDDEGFFIKPPKVMEPARVEDAKKLYREWQPDLTKKMAADGTYMPMTPGRLGIQQAMPMTPAAYGGGYYGAACGTPAGPPPASARLGLKPPGTPMGPPPMTPSGPMHARGAPATPAGPPPATPAVYQGAPNTPAGPPPATPAFYGSRSYQPGTPASRPPPGTPAGPPPMTPAVYSSMTPAGRPPMTPVGPVPETPRAGPKTPGTPGAGGPGTPKDPTEVALRVPTTPRDAVGTAGRVLPATPREAYAGVAMRYPATPAEAFVAAGPPALLPSTPAGLLSGSRHPPALTGGLPLRYPATPADAFEGTHGLPYNSSRLPTTPAGALAESHIVPQTPGPGVAGLGAAPFTPGGAAPFTPAGPAPMTPAVRHDNSRTPLGPAPFTPAGPVPMTPSGPVPQTPRGANT